jgi:predicted transcriptional regulator
MKSIEEIKKELGLSQKDLAGFFDMSYGAFANSSAKERYENALRRFYEVAKKAWGKNIKTGSYQTTDEEAPT